MAENRKNKDAVLIHGLLPIRRIGQRWGATRVPYGILPGNNLSFDRIYAIIKLSLAKGDRHG